MPESVNARRQPIVPRRVTVARRALLKGLGQLAPLVALALLGLAGLHGVMEH